MVEIVKEGTRRKTKCPKCGALLRYEYEDRHSLRNNPTLPYLNNYITCPQCKHEIKVPLT